MVAGLFLVFFGILILLRPEILVAMIASVLIIAGLSIIMIAWRFKRIRRNVESRGLNWIFKY